MGKSTISMVMFNSYVSHYQVVNPLNHHEITIKSPLLPLNTINYQRLHGAISHGAISARVPWWTGPRTERPAAEELPKR